MIPAGIQIDESLLISKTRRMIDVIGLPATMTLMEKLGGTYLELPRGPASRIKMNLLSKMIGEREAGAFFREFAGRDRKFLIPKADKILKQIRDREICAEANETSERDQALKYNLSIRQIQTIRKRGAAPIKPRHVDQFDLFAGLYPPVCD